MDALLHPQTLCNRTFDELAIGERASLTRTASERDIALFAAVSGDLNPAHMDPRFAADDRFGHVIMHGMWTAALVSAVLGTRLPGPGTVYLGQELHFRRPVRPGDEVIATVEVIAKDATSGQVRLATQCTTRDGTVVLSGVATVLAPRERIEWRAVPLPDVAVQRHDHYERIVARARALGPLRAAVVHPCSVEALQGAIEARDEGLLDPVLVAPEARLRALAEEAGISLAGVPIEAVEHSHAAARRAVELAVAGRVSGLMKGSLHTDELLGAVVAPDSGLHTGRRISHVYAMDVPSYPRPLVVTDAAINIAPSLAHKADICQNAIDLVRAMGAERPRVAVLAAVETVSAAMQATLDAAALTVMATRGQITGGMVDGPLAFDNAISPAAARTKGIVSEVAGRADILLAPNLEAGNMLAKQLIYLAGADAAGLAVGARVPIILTSRADALRVRLASAALARLAAAAREAVPERP